MADMILPDLNAWIGAHYVKQGRILILLESTYGEADATQRGDVLAWVNGGTDRTFEALYRSGATPGESRLQLFDRFACMNLVPEPLGATNDSKVTDAQLRAAVATLSARLDRLNPAVAWIASKRILPFVKPLLAARTVLDANCVTKHPSREDTSELVAVWNHCWFLAEAKRGQIP